VGDGTDVAPQAFHDRVEAGRRLARHLQGSPLGTSSAHRDLVVLGLPRGGVPVAAEVARALQAPLDVIVVRKLGVPAQPEYAMGAIGEDGVTVVSNDVIELVRVSARDLERVEREQRELLDSRLMALRAVRPREPLTGRTALLVDDGIATGSTMRAAVRVARAHGAARVIVAAPVAPPDVVSMLLREADDVVVLEQPEPFWAVGNWYEHFDPVSDDDVVALLTHAMLPMSRDVTLAVDGGHLHGDLVVPPAARGVVVFAHGSGSSRHSPRNRWVAERLQTAGMATLLIDLLTEDEAGLRSNVFDIDVLTARLRTAVARLGELPETHHLPVGLFGASTGAAAALCAAADTEHHVVAVVSRGGRPDLAGPALGRVTVPTLLIVGGDDGVVIGLNEEAAAQLPCVHRLAIVPGASHLFEEPGTLEQVADLAVTWFTKYFDEAGNDIAAVASPGPVGRG